MYTTLTATTYFCRIWIEVIHGLPKLCWMELRYVHYVNDCLDNIIAIKELFLAQVSRTGGFKNVENAFARPMVLLHRTTF